MAKGNKDLNHSDGNSTCQDMLSKMHPKNNMGTNKYATQKKGPKTPTTRVTQKGWAK